MAAIQTSQTAFSANEQITSAKLNNILLNSSFAAGALTGDNTLTLVSNQMQVGVLKAANIPASVISATKLDGAQSGSAPIFGARAYGSFDGTATSPITPVKAGNVTSITRVATGTYRVIMAIAMQNSSYCVVANATYYQGVIFTTNCSVSIINSTEFEISTTYNSPSAGGSYNSVNVNFVVFQ